MAITNIISAIGNNNSLYPLLLRDCGIEIPTKVALTYKQNKDDKDIAYLATRERLVDEYSTSAVWLGGIPLIERIAKFIIRKQGFNPEVSSGLLKEDELQGINFNIKKFKNLAPEEVKELEAISKNLPKFNKMLGGKILAEAIIPMIFMGFIIPKLVFAWTASTKEQIEKAKIQKLAKQRGMQKGYLQEFKSRTPSFKGNFISSAANMTTSNKMLITDGGYAAGRVITARNKDAAIDVGFKMAGMMFLNFVFPKMLEKFLDKTTGSLINTNLKLDIKTLADKELAQAIINKTLNIPNINDNKELLNFIDNNPNNTFVKFANKYGKIKLLKNGVRDPRFYVDMKKLKEFKQALTEVSENALKSGNVIKFLKKASFVKGANIIANVGISSFLLAYTLPKTQFLFRKKFLGLKYEPGIAE